MYAYIYIYIYRINILEVVHRRGEEARGNEEQEEGGAPHEPGDVHLLGALGHMIS